MTRVIRSARGAIALLTLVGCGPAPVPEWHEEDGYRWRELVVPARGGPGFTRMSARRTGIAFTNWVSEERMYENRYLVHGGGVALGDVDGDGLIDMFLAQAEGPNKLFRNLGGWRFEDITERAGVAAPDRYSTGTVFADVDGDDDLDLLVTAFGGPNALFVNDGTGVFTERITEAGLASTLASKTLTMADVDGDGDLDLYITNYKSATPFDLYPPEERAFDRVVQEVDGVPTIIPEFRQHYEISIVDGRVIRLERGEPDQFLLNDGTGRFEEVPFTSGRFLNEDGLAYDSIPHFFSLAARFYDIDQDGDPDLYVCNDFHHPDQFWINDGQGTFRAIPRLALRSTSVSTMAVDFADLDRDGDVDFFAVDMLSRDSRLQKTQMIGHSPVPLPIGDITNRPQHPRNTLFVNRGDNTFAEIANYAGVSASDWSWGLMLLDVDLDGYEDALITTGHPWDVNDADTGERVVADPTIPWNRQLAEFPDLSSKNVAFRNNGDLTFTEVADEWGFGLEDDVSHGIAAADLDGDGDLDVVVTRFGLPTSVFRNNATAPRVAVRLHGTAPNTRAVGARITVSGGPVEHQTKEVTVGGMYLSSSDQLYTFAAGDAEELTIAVTWRDGSQTVITSVGPNRLYEISQATARTPGTVSDSNVTSAPLFADVSALLGHRHMESPFDDHVRQPLVLDRLSQLGPGVAWYDMDGDGDEDLLIGSGRGGRLSYFRNDDGRFTEVALNMPAAQLDQTGIVMIPDGVGGTAVLVGQSTYEARSALEAFATPTVQRFDFGTAARRGTSVVPQIEAVTLPDTSSVGHLALADVDGDGDLDLFVAGRVIPAAYPVPATSRLYLNDGGQFVLDDANGATFESIGLVSAAVFSDLDGDGDPDLVLALEWGPLLLLFNQGGRFTPADETWGLASHRSRWNGVTTGDIDGDGRLDIIATSWGRNVAHRPDTHELHVYFSDFDNDGALDVLEAQFDERIGGIAPLLRYPRLRLAMPFVRRHIAGFNEYADATLDQVVGRDLARINRRTINTLDHTVFLNRGDTFEAVPLPAEAQFAPAFHVGVTDFDGDGNEDIFLSQNFFATEIATPRHDAGRGLWLRGVGGGELVPVPGQVSGIMVYGEQRGAAFADYDRDGRVDLLVSQNGGETKLFRNQSATPGLRVRLQGAPANPTAVGATIRLVYTDGRGPAREIHAGAGYWSQDGPVQVMGRGGAVTGVWVRWPGGEETETAIDAASREVTIGEGGVLIGSQ